MSRAVENHADGRIPFRIRIGVTGHRTLESNALLDATVRKQIRRVYDLLPSANTDVRLSVVSQLADGADRLVVLQVLAEAEERDHEARSEVILPLAYDDYVAVQGFSVPSREEFDRLLAGAVAQSTPGEQRSDTSEARATAYEEAGHQLVARCDVLVAIWDGEPSGGRGGTAETLLYAAARSKPCIWISTDPEREVCDNFDSGRPAPFHREVEELALGTSGPPGDETEHAVKSLEVLRRSFDALDQFNGERVSVDFKSRLEAEIVSADGVADWVAAPFVRATTLATRWQKRFAWSSRLITLSATLAAAMLAVGLSFGTESALWSLAEAGFFVLALLGIVVVHKVGFRHRWLTNRLLAERLRSAHFLAPTGADFRRQARLDAIYVDGQATGWLVRAFEEVWDCRPHKSIDVGSFSPERLAKLKRTLADEWIGEQIDYHAVAARRHRRLHRRHFVPILLLFVATIAFAVLHSLRFHEIENASIFFSVTLPAAAASLGVLLTVNQHRALGERYRRMRSDLSVVRRNILDARADSLVKVSSEAARVVTQETGAWISSMWFLDIEHP